MTKASYLKSYYIANTRIPTEKANGYQIFQMCQAFIEAGENIELLYPNRKNDAVLENQTAENYYQLRKPIPRSKIWSLDLLWVSNNRLFQFFFNLINSLTFALFLSFYLKKNQFKIKFIYIRDLHLFFFLRIFLSRKILDTFIFEVHSLPESTLKKWWHCLHLSKIKRIVTMTENLKTILLHSGISPGNIIIEHDAVDIDFFKTNLSRHQAREILGIIPEAIICSYVGKFHTNGMEKGIPEIIEAAKFVLQASPNVVFYFVGGPLDRIPYYLALIKKYDLPKGQFIFIEKRPINEVPLFLAASNILLMPHPKNNFYAYCVSPLKLFEYMSSDRPIVASSLPAIQEILEDHQNALLAVAGDARSIAEKITLLIQDSNLGQRLSQNALKKVQNYTWNNRAKRILSFFNSLDIGDYGSSL